MEALSDLKNLMPRLPRSVIHKRDLASQLYAPHPML